MSAAISHEAPYSILWRLWRLWTVNCGLSTLDCGLWRLWSTSPITQTEVKDPPVRERTPLGAKPPSPPPHQLKFHL